MSSERELQTVYGWPKPNPLDYQLLLQSMIDAASVISCSFEHKGTSKEDIEVHLHPSNLTSKPLLAKFSKVKHPNLFYHLTHFFEEPTTVVAPLRVTKPAKVWIIYAVGNEGEASKASKFARLGTEKMMKEDILFIVYHALRVLDSFHNTHQMPWLDLRPKNIFVDHKCQVLRF
jgi:hypothetical protein